MSDRRSDDARLNAIVADMDLLQAEVADLRKDVHALTDLMLQAKGALLLLKVLSIIVTGAAAMVAWVASNTHWISFK